VIVAVIASFVIVAVVIAALGLLITHVLAHGSLGGWDRHVSRWLDHQRWSTMNRLSGDATNLADTFEVAGGAAIVTVVVLLRRWGRHSFLLVASLAIELSVFLATNSIVKRPRPTVHHLGGTPSTFGYPSGHTAATVVLFGAIVVLVSIATKRKAPRIAAWIVAVAMTLAVGLSRVYRGEHYPSDVIAGVLLGIGSLMAGVFIVRVAGVNRGDTSHAVRKSLSSNTAAQRKEVAR
jgi:undecaprenyl-diphosphatase